jgi:hypothetical protein
MQNQNLPVNSTIINTTQKPAEQAPKEIIKEVTLESVAKNMKTQPIQKQQPLPVARIDSDDFFLPDPKARRPEKLDLKFAANNRAVKADLMEELWTIQTQI